MADENKDAKQTSVPGIQGLDNTAFENNIDNILDEHLGDKPPEDSSTSNDLELQDENSQESDNDEQENQDEEKASGDNQTKKSSPDPKNDAIAQKLAKISEILGDDEEVIQQYIKSHGYHKDPAWQKLLARAKSGKQIQEQTILDEETKQQLEQFKKVTSSPEYVRASMKSQGYTDEAVNAKLKEMGYEVDDKKDDLSLIAKELNIDFESIEQEQPGFKRTVSDIATISKIIAKNMINEMLPNTIKPLEQNINEITKQNSANTYVSKMKGIVSSEQVLDWKSDVEPELNKFMDENPKCTQKELFDHFLQINHSLALKKMRTKGKKEETDNKKQNLRTNKATLPANRNIPQKTGNFDEDFENAANALGL